MKLLVDMNLSPRWIDFLEGAGFKATYWSTTGAAGATDDAIMAHARANDFVVLTYGLDFGAILAATHGYKPSVVQVQASKVDRQPGSHRTRPGRRGQADEPGSRSGCAGHC